MKSFAITFMVSVILLAPLHHVAAVEVLSATELASHCRAFPDNNTSLDGEFCARYIQGFIDGAVSTDARVMLNVEAKQNGGETFSERALRTRAPNRAEYLRAARYAGFCLGDPVPLQEVVVNVVNDLNQHRDLNSIKSARSIVYASLKKHYPCEPD